MTALEEFWRSALGVTPLAQTLIFSAGGHYVEKHGDAYVFLFTDLLDGARVFAARPERHALHARLAGLEVAFDDLDYLVESFQPRPLPPSARRLAAEDASALALFLAACGEDDADTLDLTPGEDLAFGAFAPDGALLGVSRFTPIRRAPTLADVTVLVAPAARGRGLSTPLVSAVVAEARARGLTVKYRVGETNRASRAVAERLGLLPRYRLMTYRVP